MAEFLRESFFDADPAMSIPGEQKTDDTGTGVEFYFNEVAQKDFCRMVFPGDRQKIWDQPVRDEDKRRFRVQWDLYQRGMDQLHGQTMLATWGKIDSGSVELYKLLLHIQTVEQLAAFADGNLHNVPTGHQTLMLRHREMAREFMEEKRQSAGYDKALDAAEQSLAAATQAQEENADLKRQLEELQRRMDQVPAREVVYPVFVDGKGRGARYQLSDGSEVQGKAAAQQAQEALNRESAQDHSAGV